MISFIGSLLASLLAFSGAPSGYAYTASSSKVFLARPDADNSQIGPVQNLGAVIDAQGTDYYGMALKADGTLWSWGQATAGQMGDGNLSSKIVAPQQVPGLSSVKQFSIGPSVFAITSTGEVYGWGVNTSAEVNPLRSRSINSPQLIAGLSNVTQIRCGAGFVIAMKNDGTVWTWGKNDLGQLGLGTYALHKTPTQVPGLKGVVQIAAYGSRAFALKANGSVFGWGDNTAGCLGIHDTTNAKIPTPTLVRGVGNVIEIAAGTNHALALRTDGAVYAWGNDASKQLGIQTPSVMANGTDRATPVPGLTNIAHIFAGGNSSCAVDNDGFAWVFGKDNGMIDGSMRLPTKVDSMAQVADVSFGLDVASAFSTTTTPIWTNFVDSTGKRTSGSFVPGHETRTLRVHLEGGSAGDPIPLTFDNTFGSPLTPGTATIPQGASYVDVPVSFPSETSGKRDVQLLTSTNSQTVRSTVTLSCPNFKITCNPEYSFGESFNFYIYRSYPAPVGGVDFHIAMPEGFQGPETVHLPAFATKQTVKITTTPKATSEVVNPIEVSSLGLTVVPHLVVKGNYILKMSCNPAEVLGSLPTNLEIKLAAPAPAGGLTINLRGYAGSVTLPPSIVVPQGQTSATISVPTIRTTSGTLQSRIYASAPGQSEKNCEISVFALGIAKATLIPNVVVGGKDVILRLDLNASSYGGTVSLRYLRDFVEPTTWVSGPSTVDVPIGVTSIDILLTTKVYPYSGSVTAYIMTSLNGGGIGPKLTIKGKP